MTVAVFDPDLALPHGATRVAPISHPPGGLVRVERPSGRLVTLAGTRSLIRADPLRGVVALKADGVDLTGRICCAGPPAANALITPRSMVRERIGSGGGSHETVLVPERLPGGVIQWSGAAGAEGWLVEVELPLLGDDLQSPFRIRIDGAFARWADVGGRGGVVQLIGGTSAPEWRLVDDDRQGSLQAMIRPDGEHPVSLLVAGVGDPERLPSLTALAAVAAHRLRDEMEPHDAEGLVLTTGIPGLDDGLAWARATLRALKVEHDGRVGIRADPIDAAALVFGALAAGELAVARAALAVSLPSLADAAARAAWVSWVGDAGPLLDARDRLTPLLEEAPHSLRRTVAAAAEAIGETDWAAALRRPPPLRGARALPTVPSQTVLPTPAPSPAAVRSTLERFFFEGAPADGLEAASTLDLVVSGWLGAEPDAAFGRLTLAPCLPASWTAFGFEGLRLGDASLSMDMRREDGHTRFILRQDAGSTPITWIFAPRLPGTGLATAQVDGVDAAIDADLAGDRIQPRIQLPAERERVIDFVVTAPPGSSTSP